MKKRIMYITQSNGGVARYLQMLFKYIDRSKYEQILVYSNEYVSEEKNFTKLVDKIEFIDMNREINIFNDIKAAYQLSKMIEKYDPNLIYANSSKAGALARIVNLKFNKPIIYNSHGWAFNMDVSNKRKNLYKWIERILAKRCDKIIAISEEEKKLALENKICSKEKIEVIVNGIDIEEYENSIKNKIDYREELNIPKDDIVIGMVGRISNGKAPDIFLKACAEIKKQMKNVFFIIVGDGEERERIEELIEVLGIRNSILITGWVNDVYKYINIFDVAMLLTRWEGFGLAVAEYMISEKPVIATNVGAIPNIITDNQTGVLVEVDNIQDVIKAFFKIIGDDGFLKYIVKNAKKKVRKDFDVKRVASEHEKLFYDLIISDEILEKELISKKYYNDLH